MANYCSDPLDKFYTKYTTELSTRDSTVPVAQDPPAPYWPAWRFIH